MIGSITEEMPKWIQAAHAGEYSLEPVYRENAQGEAKLVAEGYEFTRLVSTEIDGNRREWIERVLILRLESHCSALREGLEGRLQRAVIASSLAFFSELFRG